MTGSYSKYSWGNARKVTKPSCCQQDCKP